MPNGIIPPGYTARFLASSSTLDGIGYYSPLEEGLGEGSLMLMELDFTDFPSSEVLESLNQALINVGVPTWPGNNYIVYQDVTKPSIYLAWVKGAVWLSIIIGMLVLFVLPTLLGIGLWYLIPETTRQMIEMIIVMVIMFFMLRMIMPMLTPAKEERVIEERKE